MRSCAVYADRASLFAVGCPVAAFVDSITYAEGCATAVPDTICLTDAGTANAAVARMGARSGEGIADILPPRQDIGCSRYMGTRGNVVVTSATVGLITDSLVSSIILCV